MRMTVRGYFVALLLAVLLPALGLTAALAWRYAEAQEKSFEKVLHQDARSLSQAVDREVRAALASLETLRHSRFLVQGDIDAFAQVARRVHADNPHWLSIILTRADGQQVMNLAAQPGQPLPNIGHNEVIQSALRGRPAVSELIIGQVRSVFLVGINVPVVIGGEVKYALGLSIPASHFQQLLEMHPILAGWITGIVDHKGTIVARSLEPQAGIGTRTTEMWTTSGEREGMVRGTGVLGVPIVGAFTRSELSGWLAVVAIRESDFNRPRREALIAAAFGDGVILGVGLLIALFLGRRVVRPIERLARSAERVVRGELPLVTSPVIEADELATALREAGRMQRDAALAQAQTEQRFEILVRGVSDYAIFMLDPKGIVANWNTGAERIKGYLAEEIVGSHFSVFYTEQDRHQDVPEKALTEAAAEGRYEAEGWRVRKDGSRFWANVVIDRIQDESGKIVGFAKITRDITERREAEQKLAQAREQLFQSQKMEAVGHLTGGIAHDFNNLLTVIIGNLDTSRRILADWKEGAHARAMQAIERALQGAQRAAALTSHLLAFSRQQPLEPKVVDVNRLLRHMQDFLKPSLGEHIQIETVGAAGLWAIEADQVQLETAILNLAVNARDAMAAGGKLTLEASNVLLDEDYCDRHSDVRPGQYVLIAATDNGVGMDKDTVERAFEPFYSTKHGQGTGLGLSQVYGFVKQSGGHVKIDSEPGQGTSVKLYLPRATAAAPAEPQEPSAPAAMGDETVLVVEDDADVRTFVVETLEELGYKVLQAEDAVSAMGAVNEHHNVDLLLTDVVLSGANGKELSRQILSHKPHLKVLFMTGYSRNAIVHDGRLDRGVEFIQKPLTQAALAAKVRRVLDRPLRR